MIDFFLSLKPCLLVQDTEKDYWALQKDGTYSICTSEGEVSIYADQYHNWPLDRLAKTFGPLTRVL